MSRETSPVSWRDDLKMARNVPESRKPGFELLLSCFEDWRLGKQLEPGHEAACAFWREQVKAKPRADWQIDQ